MSNPELAGKPYRPANRTEGMGVMDAFCCRCKYDDAFQTDPDTGEGCPTAGNAMMYDVGDSAYPPEWTHDAAGNPTCTAFEEVEDGN